MKILVYDDNPDFGGHQVMACHGVEALAADPHLETLFMFNPQNRRLADRLEKIQNLQTVEAPCATRRFQGLRNRFAKGGIQSLEKKFRATDPDLVLCIQGEIEDSSQAVLAARRAGIECASYIAIPHRMADMGAKLGGLRDRANQYLFNQPDRFIAISKSMEKLLRERGVEKPIAIVPNGISIPTPETKPRASRPTLGLFGRIEFNQKRQDFMVRTFCDFPEIFGDCRLLIAGDGPDMPRLRKLVRGMENISLLPWQEDSEAFYAAIDFLMLPSRFEGVPLVMLEALARGIPVIGSCRDGMKDILPEDWTFQAENGEAVAETFSNVRKTWRDKIDGIRERIETEMSLEAFGKNFCLAVTGR